MPRTTWAFRSTAIVLTAVVAASGCRQVSRRVDTPTPLPTYQTLPSEPVLPPATDGPELSPIPPLPGQGAVIPPVPPSTALAIPLESHFGFTAPKLPVTDDAPRLELPQEDNPPHDIQPTGSDQFPADIETVPQLSPLPMPQKSRTSTPVELDASLFLMDMFEEATSVDTAKPVERTTINGLTIEPWERQPQATPSREPQPWPANGVTPTLTITPGPIMPKWTSEPLPTRPANSRPRRLMIENSDSAIRPIE
jgi:hypothetical protein